MSESKFQKIEHLLDFIMIISARKMQYLEDVKMAFQYLFSWDNISENDSDGLRRFLVDVLDIKWVESAEIPKSEDGKTIHVHKDENSVEIIIDKAEEKAIIKTSDGRIHDDLKIKQENGKLNIYASHCLDDYQDAIKNTIANLDYSLFLTHSEERNKKLQINGEIKLDGSKIGKEFLSNFKKSYPQLYKNLKIEDIVKTPCDGAIRAFV